MSGPSAPASFAPPTQDRITGLVLAGGRGRRMGGLDKGLVAWRGEPLVGHVLRRLRPQVAQVCISANRNLDVYRTLAPVIEDPDPAAFAGPVAGILATLRVMQTDWLAVVACDLPALPHDAVARLAAAIACAPPQPNAVAGARGVHGTPPSAPAGLRAAYAVPVGQTHSLVCLLHRSLTPVLERFVADGGQQVRGAYRALDALAVAFDDAEAFTNLNAAADLHAAGL